GMSYLSPLPYYPVPRDRLRRSRSALDIRRSQKFEDAIESVKEECHIPHRRLLHPLYSNPQRYYHLANGHQRIVTETEIYPKLRPLGESPRNSSNATAKYEEKFLQKTKKDDLYTPFNDNFLNKSNFSTLPNLKQSRSYNISSPITTTNIDTITPIPIHIKNTSITTNPYNNTQTTTTTYSYNINECNNEQNLKNNIYPYQQFYNTLSYSPYINEQSLSNLEDNNIIRDPKALIHEFATKTFVSNTNNMNEINETSITPPPINIKNRKEKTFAEELRDSSLTQTQKYSNQFQKSLLKDNPLPKSFNNFYQTNSSTKGTYELNELIRDMQIKLSSPIDLNIVPENKGTLNKVIKTESSSNYTTSHYSTNSTMSTNKIGNDTCTFERTNICNKCKQIIQPDRPGVTALGNFYHVECFVCEGCGKQLAGSSFYNVQGKCFCEVDYVNSLEKCLKCHLPIKQKILRALGGAYHPECFVCHNCDKSLDGVGFTTNKENEPHCMHCFHEKYSPRCATCLKPIAPAHNETEVPRIIAMDKSYHVECYRCEDCGLQLNSKIEGKGCYPIESRLFCKACNQKRLSIFRR
uniref:LIM zinc-binding domain-containing protein n=1 Tax=Strongyloides stercoralis TaxID=6248 RepID=A0AAF5DMN1_STRER